MSEIYYRYEEYMVFDSQIAIMLLEYQVIKRTPKGAWVKSEWTKKKFILDNARKRFAYPTKELALDSFKKRKEKQIQHCEHKIIIAKAAIRCIESPDFEPDKSFKDPTLVIFHEY